MMMMKQLLQCKYHYCDNNNDFAYININTV